MKHIYIMLLCVAILSCATRKKAVDKEKTETVETTHLETNESTATEIKTVSQSSGLTAHDFSQLISQWQLDYDGEMNDGFRFYLNQTDTGWEAGAEGKGKATAQSETTRTETRTETNWKESFDSLALINQSKYIEYESRIKSLEQSKTIEKESTGFQAGVYIIIALALLVFILLYWLGRKIRVF